MGNVPPDAQGRIGQLNKHLNPTPAASGVKSAAASGGWKIMYTYTDEAPLLATYSLLPIINRFTKPCGVAVEAVDISVAARVLSLWSDKLRPDQRVPDTLGELGQLTLDATANIIKLPNVSASIPQLNACIKELQSKGYQVPDYNPDDNYNKQIYARVLGSAVNPVLRAGNSDRRVANVVKADAKVHPHRMIKPYPNTSRSKVVHMNNGDFYESERSVILQHETYVSFELHGQGRMIELREPLKVLEHEVIDAAVMNVKKLREFFRRELVESDTMVSLHLKATMMKVSDPIMFGHAVSIFYEPVFIKHGDTFQKLGVNPNNGMGDIYKKLEMGVEKGIISSHRKKKIEKDIMACYEERPPIAMVNSAKGITNLHVPSDVIIDASMPVVVRDGGKMWGWDDKLHDVKCLIPCRCYATMYKTIMEDCKANGAFDPSTMGANANVGLMAHKAEEYGSHDKTFEIPFDGKVIIRDQRNKKVYFEHNVEKGDIYRVCQAKDDAIIDWISLALKRGEVTGDPVVFWLDPNRGHDSSLIDIINFSVGHIIKTTANWCIKAPVDAMKYTLQRTRAGQNTISASGNAMRDYLTDLFPILELGTSAKMLSIVPLLNGGGLYETGAGGSAPKHVDQLLTEGHLRWDSLGEFLALAVSLQDLGEKSGNDRAILLGKTLNKAVANLLKYSKSPSRKCGEIDNRGSHFYIAVYWAQELAFQEENKTVAAEFAPLYEQLYNAKDEIVQDLLKCQGSPQDIGGYWYPDPKKASKTMRPSATLNRIIG